MGTVRPLPGTGELASPDARLTALEHRLATLEKKVAQVESSVPSDRVTLIVFSGDFDKLFAAFVIATGAAAMGSDVSLFFTFWGLHAIKKKTKFRGKKVTEKMVAAMLPAVCGGTSKLNMLGIGPRFFQHLMKEKKVQSLPQLVELAREMGVKMTACQMSMDVMGVHRDELLDGIEFAGVAACLGDSCDSRATFFI